MLVKEIIEMTKEKPVATIARDHLTIGETKLRETLKAIGGHHQTGQRGWTFQGNPEDLEKSIYDFVKYKRTTKPKATKEEKNEKTKLQANEGENKTMNKVTGETKEQANEVTRKRASFDVDIEMLKKIKHYAVEHDLKVYEVVEQALLLFAKEKGL